jgi:hypothetical protein
MAARVPDTRASVKQPDGVNSKHQRRLRDKQRHHYEERVDRRSCNTYEVIIRSGIQFDKVCFYCAAQGLKCVRVVYLELNNRLHINLEKALLEVMPITSRSSQYKCWEQKVQRSSPNLGRGWRQSSN